MSKTLFGNSSIAVVIPAFNEAEKIFRVVDSIVGFAAPIVIDDGSSDNTGNLAKKAGADVVRLERNCGYDFAVHAGLERALDRHYDYAITMDADGQHTVNSLKTLCQELIDGADIVVGIRDRRQRISESLFSLISYRIWGIQDPLCGMKGYRLSALEYVGCTNTYASIGTELCLKFAKRKYEIIQVPIDIIDRDDSSRMGPIAKVNLSILKSLIIGLTRFF